MGRAGLALAAALVALVWLAIAIAIHAEFRRASEQALRTTATLARTLEAEVAGRLRGIETILRFGGTLYLQDPGAFSVPAWLGIDPDPDILQAAIIGPDGRLRTGSDGLPADLPDRPWIAGILARPSPDRLEISPPLAGRADGRQALDIARPLHDQVGAFAGIILVTVDSGSFSRLYHRLDLQEGVIGLIGLDGVLRARVPGPDSLPGTRLPAAELAPILAGATEAQRRAPGVLDGIDRFVTCRRVEGHPLVVAVGAGADAMLAEARRQRTGLVALGAVLTLAIGGACLAVVHVRRREGRFRAQLEAVIAHVGQGIMMVDPSRRVAVVNSRVAELLDLPPGLAVPGRPVEEIVAWQERAGEFGGPAPHTHIDSSGGPDSPPVVTTRTRPDGTILEVRTAYAADGSHVRTFTDITEARRSAEAIAAARDRAMAAEAALVAALEKVPHGVLLVGADGRVQVINKAAIELAGLSPEVARPGAHFADLVRYQIETGEVDGDSEAAQRAWRALHARDAEAETYERRTRDGRVLEVRTTFLADGRFIRTYTDVTAHHAALRAQEAARDQAVAAQVALAAAFENAPLGILLIGADRRVQFVNGIAIDLLDLPPELARPGADVRDLVRLQLGRGDLAPAPAVEAKANAALDDPMVVGEPYERPLRDGRMVEVRARRLPDGRVIRTYTDVTARHAALRAQEEARLAAEAAVRSRTEFLAIVSHELRTPLNAVIGLSELLLARQPRADQEPDLRMVAESGRQLLGLVDDILDVSRLERGRVRLRQEVFDPRATLAALAGLIAPRAAAKGLDFTLRLDPAVPEAGVGDQERLRQALLKLLDNAVKFTEAGRITLGATVLAEEAGGWRLGITVSDTGIGIAPDAGARLFEPFTQADSSTARRFGGLGLGLAVSRLLLESMGGSIAVESVAGTGSTFRVELPLRRPPACRTAGDGGHGGETDGGAAADGIQA